VKSGIENSQAEVKQRVEEAARVLGLEALLERLPRALSGGQRQSVAMGRAIVRRPSAFLFDEPLSNLDAELRMAMRGEIKRVHKAVDTTTVYVTHDQVEAMTLADRVVVMRGGEVQQIAPPRLLYADPANKFVAGFIGSPGMNFFSALLEEAAAELRLDGGERLALPASLADRCAPYRVCRSRVRSTQASTQSTPGRKPSRESRAPSMMRFVGITRTAHALCVSYAKRADQFSRSVITRYALRWQRSG
jgi:multiple sugar transport system ATP-binding protein